MRKGFISAIPTTYKGIEFKSRLEARWAIYMDCLGLNWEYEPFTFRMGDIFYRPDFKISLPVVLNYGNPSELNENMKNPFQDETKDVWLEIKPDTRLDDKEYLKLGFFAWEKQDGVFVVASGGYPDESKLYSIFHDSMGLTIASATLLSSFSFRSFSECKQWEDVWPAIFQMLVIHPEKFPELSSSRKYWAGYVSRSIRFDSFGEQESILHKCNRKFQQIDFLFGCVEREIQDVANAHQNEV